MKARTLKPGQLTDKDMSVLRENASTRDQHKSSKAVIRDYSLNHRIEVRWNLNTEAERDRMFKLKIDNLEVICDAEEFLRAIRWV